MPYPKDPLLPDRLRHRLGRSLFGRNILFHETLNSTNTLAKALASEGAAHGTLVVAEKQTAGRGRMGRRWLSPKYKNLLFSLLLRPPVLAEQVFSLTMILALAAVDGMEAVSGLRASIKWPNDLYAAGKKLGGILTEFCPKGKSVEYVVLGLGLNVNWKPGRKEEMVYQATSILLETGSTISRTDLLAEILKRFEGYYGEVLRGKMDPLYVKWNERSMVLGKYVKIETSDGEVCGRAVSIDRDGALRLVDELGHEQKVICGDVSLREIKDEGIGDRKSS